MTEPAINSAAPAPKTALWEDFIDIFTAPASVFRRREHSGFGWPLLFLTIACFVVSIGTHSLVYPAIDADLARKGAIAMKKHPEVKAEQLQQQREVGEKIGPYFVALYIPIAVLLVALVTWLVGKAFNSSQTFGKSAMVATYAFFPRFLGFIAGAILAFVQSPEHLNGMGRLTLGPAALMNPDSTAAVLVAFCTRLDVFTIWGTILLAIGLQVTGKVEKSQSYLAVALVWVIGAIPSVLGALN